MIHDPRDNLETNAENKCEAGHTRNARDAGCALPAQNPLPAPGDLAEQRDRHADRDEGEEKRTPNTFVLRVDGERPYLRDGAGIRNFARCPRQRRHNLPSL